MQKGVREISQTLSTTTKAQ